MSPVRFHWRLLQGGEGRGNAGLRQHDNPSTALPDLPAQIEFCRQAEAAGIDSLLVDFSYGKPDSILMSAALALHTTQVRLMVAVRSGLMAPELFVQQIDDLAELTEGRLSLNVVAGHTAEEQRYYGDFLAHDERYARTSRFLDECRALWERRGRNRPWPETYVSGGSAAARELALRHGNCWLRVVAETPEQLAESVGSVLDEGCQVGVRLSVIARPTREEALREAAALVGRPATDGWLTAWLWNGAVKTHGAPAVAIVGTPSDVCAGINEFRRAGVSQFILSGWPKLDAMTYFGQSVIPSFAESFHRA